MKREIYEDKIVLNEELVNERLIEPNRSLFKTDITFRDYNGDDLIRVSKHRGNMTVLGGRLNILEQTFGITPDVKQHLFLNNMLPKLPDVSLPDPTNPGSTGGSDETTPEFYTAVSGDFFKNDPNGTIDTDLNSLVRRVKWFCVGNGGEDKRSPLIIHNVHNWETRLYGLVPLRMVKISNDLPADVRKLYGMKTLVEYNGVQYYAYWAKAFTIKDNRVFSKIGTKDYHTDSVDGIGKLKPSHSNPVINNGTHELKNETHLSYITIDINISKYDFKEYYKIVHDGKLALARLTELGFIMGKEYNLAPENGYTFKEISYPEMFAKITHDPVYLTSENARREASYNIYS